KKYIFSINLQSIFFADYIFDRLQALFLLLIFKRSETVQSDCITDIEPTGCRPHQTGHVCRHAEHTSDIDGERPDICPFGTCNINVELDCVTIEYDFAA